MSFGEQILSRRKELGLTQQNVADELHITRQTLSKWENNKSYPDLKLLLALSEIYHVSVDSLLRENKDLTNRDKASQAFNIIRGLFWLLIGFYFWSPSNYWSNILIPILFCILLEYLSYKECFFLGKYWYKQSHYTLLEYIWTALMIIIVIYGLINKHLNILLYCFMLEIYFFFHQYIYKPRK